MTDAITDAPADHATLSSPLSAEMHPRLLPGVLALHRQTGELQIGVAPPHAVVIDDLSESLSRLLRRLDGSLSYGELVARTEPGDRATLGALLSRLYRTGLVEDASRNPPDSEARVVADTAAWSLRTGQPRHRVGPSRARSAVLVHGDGRLAVSVGSLLAAAGVGRVHVAATGVVQPEQTGCGYTDADVGRPMAEAAAAALRRASSSVRTEPLGAGTYPDLVILADTMVPCPELVATLTAARLPHLLVRAREGNGWIGPLVVPGRSACLRCLDLHRTERDPCWPTVATQLAGRALPVDLVCAQATASAAAAQALRILAGAETATWDATLEIDPFTAEITRRWWLPHPQCDCAPSRARQASMAS